jgi:DNA repair protein RadA/Sms
VAVVPSEPGVAGGPRSPESWTVDGLRVLDVPDVTAALRLLQLRTVRGGLRAAEDG